MVGGKMTIGFCDQSTAKNCAIFKSCLFFSKQQRHMVAVLLPYEACFEVFSIEWYWFLLFKLVQTVCKKINTKNSWGVCFVSCSIQWSNNSTKNMKTSPETWPCYYIFDLNECFIVSYFVKITCWKIIWERKLSYCVLCWIFLVACCLGIRTLVLFLYPNSKKVNR